jgi:FHA domain-containing protein
VSVDLVSLARSLERHQFVSECPFPLLLAVNEPVPSTELFADEFVTQSLKRPPEPPPTQPVKAPMVYAVRKIHTLLPHGIVLGRVETCDIVIHDRAVSKAHALFQEDGGRWTVSDLGSRNGTHVGHTRAVPRGPALPVAFGDVVSFAFRTFYFVDAASAWDRIRGDMI